MAKYPRQKLVMTSPVEFPMHGKFNKLEISKEELMDVLGLGHQEGRRQGPDPGEGGGHRARGRTARSASRARGGTYRARSVILALGPPRHAAQARHSGRGTAQGDVRADRGRGVRQREDPRGRRRRQRGRGGDGAGLPEGQPGHPVLPAGGVQPDQGAERAAASREAMQGKKLRVLFSSQPVEVRADVGADRRERAR